MTLVVVKDKREIYDKVLQDRQASRQQERITVRAPDLDEQVRNDLRSEIQAVVARTLQRRKPIRVKAPSDAQVRQMISKQLRSAPPEEFRQRRSRRPGVRVNMSGLPLPTEDVRTLESEVRQIVLRRLADVSPRRSRQQAVVCGCGFGCCTRPGHTIDLTQIDPIPWPGDPRTTPAVIEVNLPPGRTTNFDDAIKMSIWAPDVEHGDPDIPRDMMMIGLRIDDTVEPGMWAKEIEGWAYCECGVRGYKVHQDHSTPDYQWMMIDQAAVDTLAFRKAIVLGYDNKYSFDSGEFWKLFGGLIITFDWLCDQKCKYS
jgi:hypothetical protein